jgi:hypothetical protein
LDSEEGRLNEEIRLAGKAGDVLSSEAFKAAFHVVETALLGAMRSSAISDERLRLRLLDKYECLHALNDCLRSMVDTGMMAEEQLRQKTVSQRVKEFLNLN